MDYIKIPDLKTGHLYKLAGCEASYGLWVGNHNAFLISKFAYGDTFLSAEDHYDVMGTAKPLKEIHRIPSSLLDKESTVLMYLNEKWEALE